MKTSKHETYQKRSAEQGNIVLIAALIVLGLGLAGVGLTRLVQLQFARADEMRSSNFGGTLAQNVAESGLNYALYEWGLRPGDGKYQPKATDSIQLASASVAALATTSATYSIQLSKAWSITSEPATAELTVNATVSNSAGLTFTRTVRATVATYSARAEYVIRQYQVQ
ncbi:hypothetical protein J7643_07340 [bacterium]|nr:hypothetical protein [bacterium]